jgi:mono/diheme cytochrome c family protein
MRRRHFSAGLAALAMVALPGVIGYRTTEATQTGGPTAATAVKPAADPALVERGKYLVSAMGCHDCHTPWKVGPQGPEPDMTRALTGHPSDMVMPPPPKLPEGPWIALMGATNTAWAGPWGVSFTANLTPDKETGLGNWNAEMFIAALRTGRQQGKGRPILPPMPWQMIRNLTDDDLRGIFAYLQSLQPVHNRVPQPVDPPEPGR